MYEETDAPNPVNYYGKTKWYAEEAVKKYPGDWAIARTVLVYGKPLAGRNNILTVVKDKLEKGEEYNVVSDQYRTPTYVKDLAAGIILLLEKKATGIYHLSGNEILTPYDMAVLTARYLLLDSSLIKNVTAATFSQPAQRPLKTGFIIDKAKKELGFYPIPFAEGLQKTLSRSEIKND
jgi:dTDP-4-dehydrorhamnose reductase